MAGTPLARMPRDRMDGLAAMAWDRLEALTGEPAFVEAFALAPELLEFAMVAFYQRLFFEGRVPERYKQLARLRLSLAHGCRTCNLQNVPGARAAGFTDAQVAAIEGDRAAFTEAERAVLDLADRMLLTNPGGRLDAALHARLRAHFDDAQILELAMVMGVIGGLAKMSFVLDLVEREAACPFTPAVERQAA
jgi:alkylhydroperoxidase family enzyme